MEIVALTTAFDAGCSDAFIAAAGHARERDDAAIERLCSRLSDIAGDDSDEIAEGLLDFPMPAGVMHARVFNAEDGMEFACVLSRNGKPVTAEEISLLVTLSEPFMTHRWVETSSLPERDAGVLDLLIRFEPRA